MIRDGECGTFSPVMLDCFRMAKYELLEAAEQKFSFADSESEEMEPEEIGAEKRDRK